ncbi:hypothetical protein OG500_37935 [Kitasatospora sp. NBC_01250]|uniref:hypothetical protein n=1 Tax=Kitasatospora sp. NBC_01250 TaxID=2903571 RepID=UPI002E35D25B|nr:hypothetical protein [Kitasatospora sp. NBC_01250]
MLGDVSQNREHLDGRAGVSEIGGIIHAVDLRVELVPPSVSRQQLEELCGEIVRISDLVLRRAENAGEEIVAFNARTGHDYAVLDFAEYDGGRDLVEFALEAARPARPRIADVTTDELVEVVCRILAGGPESNYYLRLLGANVTHPRVSDLIFHPPAGLRDASAEQIVNEALKYRPVVL